MTLNQPPNMVIVDVRQNTDTWCVFEHVVGDDQTVIYVGVCKLHELYSLKTARGNSEWTRMYANGGSVGIRVVVTSTSYSDMIKFGQNHMRELPEYPRCNERGVSLYRNVRPIRCIDTEQVFQNQTEAANALGIDQASISRVLANRQKRAGGFQFEYYQ